MYEISARQQNVTKTSLTTLGTGVKSCSLTRPINKHLDNRPCARTLMRRSMFFLYTTLRRVYEESSQVSQRYRCVLSRIWNDRREFQTQHDSHPTQHLFSKITDDESALVVPVTQPPPPAINGVFLFRQCIASGTQQQKHIQA